MMVDSESWFKAAAAGDTATIRAMVVAGIDLEMRDDQERTAFNIASQNRQTDVMTTILAARQMRFVQKIGLDPFAVRPDVAMDTGTPRKTA
jgi:hypothetical protein